MADTGVKEAKMAGEMLVKLGVVKEKKKPADKDK